MFILGIFVVVMIGMFWFVIPNMVEFLKDFDQDLPLVTRIMMSINVFMTTYGWIILLLLIAAGIILYYWNKTPSGRQFFDNLKLNMPIFGKVFRMSYIAHFTKNLSTLVKGGLPIIQALEISGQVSGNVVFAQIIDRAKNEVSKGNTMSSVFMKEPIIPPVVSQMIKTGETTGKLDYVLDNLADYYTKEVDYLVDNLSTLIEPILIVALGAMVGFLMAAVLLPIYNLTSTL